MRTTDQATERFRAESRLRELTVPGASQARPTGSEGFPGRRDTGDRMPPIAVPPSFEALRAAVDRAGPALDPGRSGTRLLIVAALVAVVAGGLYAWRAQPEPEPLAPPAPVSGPSLTGAAAPSRPRPSPAAEVTVHVTGKVRRPGVVVLPGGSRVADAVRAAGGVRGEASAGFLNLARRLVDGEQIVVGPSAQGTPAAQGVPAAPVPVDPATAVLDLNVATAEQFEQLPGVGEVLARRIVEYRDGRGGFQSVGQLREVSGIGERKYADIKDRVRV